MATITRKFDASAMAREHTQTAIEAVAELLQSVDPRIRLEAAKTILDRGHGKPINAIVQIPATQAQRRQMAALTDDELDEAIDAEVDMPELPAPAPSATMVPRLGGPSELDALNASAGVVFDDPLLR